MQLMPKKEKTELNRQILVNNVGQDFMDPEYSKT